MSWFASSLALATALARLVLAWLAERPTRIADERAARIARQRDEAARPPASAGDLIERMRDGKL